MSYGYYKICPKCYRKYGRHYRWCVDCTPKARPDKNGVYPRPTYDTIFGKVLAGTQVSLHFCCSKKLDLEKRLAICDNCRSRYKCFTENEDH